MHVTGANSLRDYLTAAEQTTAALLSADRPELILLSDTYDFFRKVLWAKAVETQPVSGFLAINSAALWMASVRIALSGHEAATYPVLRTALESTCYAHVTAKDVRAAKTWADRNKDNESRRACRATFTSAVKQVSQHMLSAQPFFGDVLERMYDALIDFGAHPNSTSLLAHVHLQPDDGSDYHNLNFVTLYEPNAPQVRSALSACADIAHALARVQMDMMGIGEEAAVGGLTALVLRKVGLYGEGEF